MRFISPLIALSAARAAAFVPSPPEVTALHLKETLNKKGFVRIPDAEFRARLGAHTTAIIQRRIDRVGAGKVRRRARARARARSPLSSSSRG